MIEEKYVINYDTSITGKGGRLISRKEFSENKKLILKKEFDYYPEEWTNEYLNYLPTENAKVPCHTSKYFYDGDILIKENIKKTGLNIVNDSIHYKYDKKQRLIRKSWVNAGILEDNLEKEIEYLAYNFQYNDNDLLIVQHTDDRKDVLVFNYDDKDRLIQKTSFNEFESIDYQFSYKYYGESKNILEKTYRGKSSKILFKETFTYDYSGKLIEKLTEVFTGIEANRKSMYVYVNDEIVREVVYIEDKQCEFGPFSTPTYEILTVRDGFYANKLYKDYWN